MAGGEGRRSECAGINSRLDEMQAAILRVLLPKLDEMNTKRREIAQIYESKITNDLLDMPIMREGVAHVYHQYVISTDKRDGLKSYLAENGVGCGIHYPEAAHMQPAYADVLQVGAGLPITEAACASILSLPMFPALGAKNAEEVARVINSWSGE